ncbi:hypothetical protein KQI65_15780 [bacterium]|nr:hypothetical protein [bacterium]
MKLLTGKSARYLLLLSLVPVLTLQGCFTFLGYSGGSWLDHNNEGTQSFAPSETWRYLRSGETVQCVLKDSTRLDGAYFGAGLWKSGDSLLTRDQGTFVPAVWHRQGERPPGGEFYGLRLQTPEGISVVDTVEIAAVQRLHFPVWWRVVLTPIGFAMDMIGLALLIGPGPGMSFSFQ